jgi:ketosteroid isomerase-like protein
MPTTPAAVIEKFGECVNRGDLEGALALYDRDAAFQAAPDGPPVRGLEAIREALGGFMALSPQMTGQVVKVVEAGDVALVMNRWSLRGTDPEGAPVELGGTSADVVGREADGTWRVLVDDPWGAAPA